MKRKLIAILTVCILALSLVACGGGEETTLSGMVVAVDGTVVSIVEMSGNMGGMNFGGGNGERPEMQGGAEGFQGFGNFDPEAFEGTFPEGMEGFGRPGDFDPEAFEGTLPEGMTIPEGGERPQGENGSGRPGFGNFASDMETKDVDIADAHISVEIDGGKASGSMEDITPGTTVTITLNGKGKATNVLVSQSGFGGGRRQAS